MFQLRCRARKGGSPAEGSLLEHWDVYVALSDEPRAELPRDLRERIVDWMNERELDEVAVHTEAADATSRGRTQGARERR